MSTPCTTCIKANPIPNCSEEWVIGQVPGTNDGDVLFYVLTNVATGYVWTGETDAVVAHGHVHGHNLSHIVPITLPEGLTELDGHYYKLELYEDEGLYTPINFHIDGQSGCRVEFTTFKMSTEVAEFNVSNCSNE